MKWLALRQVLQVLQVSIFNMLFALAGKTVDQRLQRQLAGF
jgi:hypothetical protein